MNARRSTFFLVMLGVVSTLFACGTGAGETVATVGSEAGPIRVVEVAHGLKVPWSLAFLPDGRMLVTERPGRMRMVSPDGRFSEPLAGLPKVYAEGQGGLLDVVLGPGFVNDGLIYFSYAEPVLGGARTAVARARLDAANLRVREVTRIFAQNEAPSGSSHWAPGWFSTARATCLSPWVSGFLIGIGPRAWTAIWARSSAFGRMARFLTTILSATGKKSDRKYGPTATAMYRARRSIRKLANSGLMNTAPRAATRSISSCPAAITAGR